MSEEQARNASCTAHPDEGSSSAAANIPWRHYPHLDAAIEVEKPAVLLAIEKSRAAIDRIARSGAPKEKDRARTAAAAYDRALELYHRLVDLRDQALRTASNMRAGNPINE